MIGCLSCRRVPDFTFAAETAPAGFEACRDLYATGTDVTATGLPFHAQVSAPAGGVAQDILTRRLEQTRTALRRPPRRAASQRRLANFGFCGESHFSRAFRSTYGTPLGRYRFETAGARLERPADRQSSGIARHMKTEWYANS